MKKHPHRRIRLWFLMAAMFTLLMTATIGSIILTYSLSLERSYEAELRQQLSGGLQQMKTGSFSSETAEELRAQGIQSMVVRVKDGEISSTEGSLPLSFRPDAAKLPSTRRNDGQFLLELVRNSLNDEDGSFYLTDSDSAQEEGRSLTSRAILLCGREGSVVFCLHLPVESTNAAISVAIRLAMQIFLIVWLLCMVLLYRLSVAATRPHRRIAEIAAQIADMDFSRRCPPALTVELDELSNSINSMADSLEENLLAQREANERLRVELAERERQQKLTAELIANLSHDLKTPIAVISGFAEGLLEGVAKTPEKQQSYYEMILRESEHMQQIVTQMLALGRMESGETPIRLEEFDLSRLLDEVLESFQREIEREGLRLRCDCPRPCMVYTDYTCARQSILNYVQNAVYHINRGSDIWVHTEERPQTVRLCVTNSSAPIPDGEAARIWDKLYRGDPARQRHNNEMGLGLSIVKGNMERLGHSYGFENSPDFPGVTFWLELPRPQSPQN